MKCDDCCQRGGNNFDFPHADPNAVTDFQFFVPGENNMIVVTYVKDGVLYFSSSFDCGKTFGSPRQLLTLKGGITQMQLMAKGDHMVVAFIETIDNKRYRRALAGSLNQNENSFSFRVCESETASENVGSVSVTICDPPGEFKSIDHAFSLESDGSWTHRCQGHG